MTLRLARRDAHGGSPLRPHRIGGTTLVTDLESPMLVPFRLGVPADAEPSLAVTVASAPEPSRGRSTLFEANVELGGATRHLRCATGGDTLGEAPTLTPTPTPTPTPTSYELEIGLDPVPAAADSAGSAANRPAGARTLRASVEANGTVTYELDDPTPAAELAELLLGAPLLLALALRGTFCLHAGAVLLPEGAIAFLGESGAGKSTLARELHRLGFPRVADDLLLVGAGARAGERDGKPPVALPRFPQPRLAPSDQPASAPDEARLAAVYVLSGPAGTIERRRASAADGALALARHTVAARLFAPDLLARHLAFVGSLAAATPVRHLRYPWRPGGIEAVAEAIREDLQVPAADQP